MKQETDCFVSSCSLRCFLCQIFLLFLSFMFDCKTHSTSHFSPLNFFSRFLLSKCNWICVNADQLGFYLCKIKRQYVRSRPERRNVYHPTEFTINLQGVSYHARLYLILVMQNHRGMLCAQLESYFRFDVFFWRHQ